MKKLIDAQKNILVQRTQNAWCMVCQEVKTCLALYAANNNLGSRMTIDVVICYNCASQAAEFLKSNADVLEDGQVEV